MTYRTIAPIVVFLLVAGAAGAVGLTGGSSDVAQGDQIAASADADPGQPVGSWTGTINSAAFRGSAFLNASYASRGDFWFTIDEDLQVDGYAVVTYTPNLNVDGLNAALGTIRSLGSAAVGVVLPFPLAPFIFESITADTIAVRGWYSQAMYTVEGPITGSYAANSLDTDADPDGQLTIDWADDPELQMPITFWLDGVDGADEITREELAAEPLWLEGATISEQGGVLQGVSTYNLNPAPADGVTTSTQTTWSARRA
ncbi:MAG: hypothetical protein ACRD2C_28230 [Acidimicrobiales bacterium]